MAKLQGPLKPIGRDTQGNVVTSTSIESEQSSTPKGIYYPPVFSGGKVVRSGGVYTSASTGSGGGSSSSGAAPSGPSQAEQEAQRQAEIKRQQELQKAQQERQKLEQELQQKRQERIEAGKISGQLSSKKVSGVVEPFDPLKSAAPLPSERELGVNRSFTSRASSYVASGFRSIFNVRTREDLDRQNGLFVGRDKSKTIQVRNIPTGSVIDQTLFPTTVSVKQRVTEEAIIGGGAGTPREFIVQDIEKKVIKEAQRDLDKKTETIQTKINQGKITVEEGTQILQLEQESINKKAQEQFEKEVSSSEKLKSKGRSEGSLIKLRGLQKGTNIAPLVETGVLVGGSLVAPVTTSAVIGSMGAREFIVGSGLAVGGSTTKERLIGGARATLGLGFAATGVYGASKTIGKQITQAGIDYTLSQKTIVTGEEVIRGPKGSVFEVYGLKKGAGESRLLVSERLPVFDTSKKAIYGTTEGGGRVLLQEGGPQTFSLTGGKGVSRLTYYDFNKGKYVTKKVSFSLFGRGQEGGQANFIKQIGGTRYEDPLKGYKSSYGVGGVIQEGKIKPFKFGGITAEEGQLYKVAGGEIKRGRVNLLNGKKSAIADLESYGFIKRYQVPETSDGIKLIIGEKTKTPLSKTTGLIDDISKQQARYKPPVVFDIKPEKIVDLPKPSYVGGQGGLSSQSLYAQASGTPVLNTEFLSSSIKPFVQQGESLINVNVLGGRNINLRGVGILTGELNKGGGLSITRTPLFETKVSTTLYSSIITKPKTGISTKGSTSSILSQLSLQPQVIKQRQSLLLGQAQPTKLRQRQLQINEPASKLSNVFAYPPTPYGLGGFGLSVPYFPIPKLPSFTGRPGRRRTQTRKQRTGYQPSFTASALGITASKTPLLAPGALSIRPIIQTPSKKKKKRKKIKII